MRNKRRMSQPNLKESYRILWSGGGDGGGSGDAASYAMDKLPPRNKMGGLVAKNPRESYMDLGRLIRMKSFRGSGASLGISENPRESSNFGLIGDLKRIRLEPAKYPSIICRNDSGNSQNLRIVDKKSPKNPDSG